MIERETIEAHLKQILTGTEIFLVDVRVDSSNRITVHIDKIDGISIDDCVRISRDLEGRLDRDREDFALEVSSPGLDAPFKVTEQYRKNIGKMVKVQSADGETYLGILKQVEESGIRLEIPAVKKNEEPELKDLAFGDIVTTRIDIQF